MYLTFDEYVNMGGTLEEQAYTLYEYEAEYIINWYTFNPTTRKWELCQLKDINTKGIIQFGDPYGAPGFAITSKEYKSFFNGTNKIGVALGITPNKNQYINFFLFYCFSCFCRFSF